MASRLKKAVLNFTLGTGLLGMTFASPLAIVPYFSNKEAKRLLQTTHAVQRSYEIEKELNKSLQGKQGLEAIAASHQPEFREKYAQLIQEYATLTTQEDVATSRKEISAARIYDNTYILLSVMGIAAIAGGVLANLGSITSYLCSERKQKYYDL